MCTCTNACILVQLSQILGHSDQLYTKLPRGLRVWQYSNAITVTGLAAAVSTKLFVEHVRIVGCEGSGQNVGWGVRLKLGVY